MGCCNQLTAAIKAAAPVIVIGSPFLPFLPYVKGYQLTLWRVRISPEKRPRIKVGRPLKPDKQLSQELRTI